MPEPVIVSVEVGRPRQEVFEYVDVLANHEHWMGHLFKNWSFEGPRRGVGAIAKAQVDAPAAREKVSFEVVESTSPERIVEQGESAHGKRETRGTYRFTELDGGGTLRCRTAGEVGPDVAISIRPDTADGWAFGDRLGSSCSGGNGKLHRELSSPMSTGANVVSLSASSRRPSRASRRHVNSWLADSPFRRAVADTCRGAA